MFRFSSRYREKLASQDSRLGGSRLGLGVISSVGFLTMFGMSLGNMLQPLYAKVLEVEPAKIGLLFFLSHVVSGVLRIPVGVASDVYGRKRFIFVGAVIWVFSGFLFLISQSFSSLIIPFILWGVGAAFYFTANVALIADLAAPEEMTKAYGTVGLFQTAGSIVGPLIGGFVADSFGVKTSYLVSVVSFSVATVVALRLPNVLSIRQENKERLVLREKLTKIFSEGTDQMVKVFALLYIFHGLYTGMFQTILPLFLKESYGMIYSEIGIINTVSMVGNTIGFYLISRLPKGFNLKNSMIYSTILSGFFAISYILIDIPLVFLVISFFMGLALSFGTFSPVGRTVLMRQLPPGARGLASGITLTSWRAGLAGGSLMLGFLWSSFGMISVFYFSVIILLIESIIIWIRVKHENT